LDVDQALEKVRVLLGAGLGPDLVVPHNFVEVVHDDLFAPEVGQLLLRDSAHEFFVDDVGRRGDEFLLVLGLLGKG
jgi:hypothetical protein